MIFGRKDLFAIQVDIFFGESHIFSSICFWIKNEVIGDPYQKSVLKSEIKVFDNNLKLRGCRSFPQLKNYGSKEITDYLIKATWEPDLIIEKQFYNLIIDESLLQRLDVNSHEGECFQGYYTFLIEFESYDWLLSKDTVTNKYIDVMIPKGYFYECVESFVLWSSSFFDKSQHRI